MPANTIKLISWPGDANNLLTGWSSVYLEPAQQEAAHMPTLASYGNYIILSIAMDNDARFARGQLCFVGSRLYYRYKDSNMGFGQWSQL